MEKRCLGCMKIKKQHPICEHCGFHEGTENLPYQLTMGTILRGQYLVGKVLGQGGFGITYMGWDLSLETPIAIKEYYPNGIVNRENTLTVEVNDSGTMGELFRQNRDRFLREARILARLSNVPGIVRVHNLFAENNTAYIVMEFVEGIDLRQYIKRRGTCLRVEEAFRFLMPVMEALQKVHGAGLVHRDISPDNIMIQSDGTVKLVDFGAARNIGQTDINGMPSQSTEAILKHGFAPLEQYRRRGNLGPWTDVYALCATLYYCLTGKVPADAPERIMGDDNVDWTRIPGLSEQQIQILGNGMEIMPDKRIASVEKLLEDLRGSNQQVKECVSPIKSSEPAQQPMDAVPEIPEYMADVSISYPVYTVSLEKETGIVSRKKVAPSPTLMEAETPKPAGNPSKPKKWISAVAAVLLVIALAVFLPNKEKNSSPISPTAEPETVESTGIVSSSRVLRADPQGNTVFGSSVPRESITKIVFRNTLPEKAENAWDVSEAGDSSVVAWVQSSKLYIAAEGKVSAPENCRRLFADYTNVEEIVFNGSFDTSDAVIMEDMFAGCRALKRVNFDDFDTSGVTSMKGMFSDCQKLSDYDIQELNSPLWIPFGNSGVLAREFSNVFDSPDRKQQIRSICFQKSAYNAPADAWDVSRAMDGSVLAWIEDTEANCTLYIAADGGVHAPVDSKAMFSDFRSLKTIDFGDAFYTDQVKYAGSMFQNCVSLETINLKHFDTSSMSDISGMFKGCTTLTSVNLSGHDTSGISEMSSMFEGCTALTSVNLRNLDLSEVRSLFWVFLDCSSLTTVNMSGVKTKKLSDLSFTFSGCSALQTVDLSSFNTESLESLHGTFAGCTSLEKVNLKGFKTSGVYDMRIMFQNCSSLKSLDISHFDTSSVKYWLGMFEGCSELKNLKLGRLETDSTSEYDHFMDDGVLVNGKPWVELFR